MYFQPLIDAGPAIQIHVAAAIAAFGLGAFVLWSRKGTPTHKMLGKLWVALMIIASLSSFFIHTLRVWGAFSPLHLLSIFVPLALVGAVVAARKGNIRRHRIQMQATFVGGLIVAGGFAFLPGRLMHEVVISPWLGGTLPVSMPWMLGLAAAVLFVALWYLANAARGRYSD